MRLTVYDPCTTEIASRANETLLNSYMQHGFFHGVILTFDLSHIDRFSELNWVEKIYEEFICSMNKYGTCITKVPLVLAGLKLDKNVIE